MGWPSGRETEGWKTSEVQEQTLRLRLDVLRKGEVLRIVPSVLVQGFAEAESGGLR